MSLIITLRAYTFCGLGGRSDRRDPLYLIRFKIPCFNLYSMLSLLRKASIFEGSIVAEKRAQVYPVDLFFVLITFYLLIKGPSP